MNFEWFFGKIDYFLACNCNLKSMKKYSFASQYAVAVLLCKEVLISDVFGDFGSTGNASGYMCLCCKNYPNRMRPSPPTSLREDTGLEDCWKE
jgi:hypothetical protein